MEVWEAVKKRRSIRNYLEKEVEEDKLMRILEAAQQAPSASNRQEGRFVVVRDKERRKKLAKAAKNQKFVAEAPIVIAVCAKTDNHVMTCGQLCYPIDIACACDHMTLQAVELGLGTCWVGAFYEGEVKKVLNIPEEIRVVELLVLGYPKEEPHSPKQRLSLQEIVFYEEGSALMC